ncbi:hypothetical protein K466DRAFT_589394 [Polyporus arcularius HHB13444]|uniref:Uncharacterized protein n=1 Tax=Polyporus arcularius HHB13444 TaxID=1314778 RepID=A0A5C3P5L9_9APHY|nr:hypothetical protein K466DRAFT_589394 [Polyporus arcularius HHB13444]
MLAAALSIVSFGITRIFGPLCDVFAEILSNESSCFPTLARGVPYKATVFEISAPDAVWPHPSRTGINRTSPAQRNRASVLPEQSMDAKMVP